MRCIHMKRCVKFCCLIIGGLLLLMMIRLSWDTSDRLYTEEEKLELPMEKMEGLTSNPGGHSNPGGQSNPGNQSNQGIQSNPGNNSNLGRPSILDGHSNPICSNEERLERLTMSCPPNNTVTLVGMSDKKVKVRASTLSILVDDAHKLLVCVPPKAGCTTWKTILANNSHKGPLPRNYSVMTLHFGKLKQFGIKHLRELSGPDIRRVVRHYSKVIVVRHPLERVLSAYVDKLQSGLDNKWQTRTGTKILKLLGRDMSNKDAKQGKGVLFEEFLWYLNKKGARNEHWNTYEQACWPCGITYDKIIKLETQDADSEEIIKHQLEGRGLKTKGNAVGKGPLSASKQGRKMEEFKNVSSNNMAFLLDFYGKDMQMFGYSWQPGNFTAVCHNGSNQRHCC